MKFKIVVDSSANLNKDYLKDENVGFDVIPLTLRLDGVEYVDDGTIDIPEFLKKIGKSKECKSSCPSPQDFLNSYDGAEYVFVITITKKLSGSFNSATVARNMHDNSANIFVIDSKSTAGSMVLLVDKIYEYIQKGWGFAKICEEIISFRDNYNLLFALDCFDNLVRNGRMSKVVAFIANLASIRPLCFAEDGEIKIKEKIRTYAGVLKRLVANIGKMCEVTKGRDCIITHTNYKEVAEELKKEIEERYEFDHVRVMENQGLCAFYSLQNGLMVAF